MPESALYPRLAQPVLVETLADSPVVLIHGPRQCGKTTLAQVVGNPMGYAYISFDDDVARAAAEADPTGFVGDLPPRVIMDEVQRVPALFAALKVAVDRDRTPGRFLLTGSANVLLLPKLADSLAGRMAILRLHPLAQCELDRQPSRFLDTLFAAGFKTRTYPRLADELAARIAAGGYPAALARPQGADAPPGTATTSKPLCSATCATWPASARWKRCHACWRWLRRKRRNCST